jgi:hypothetical protein
VSGLGRGGAAEGRGTVGRGGRGSQKTRGGKYFMRGDDTSSASMKVSASQSAVGAVGAVRAV